MPPLAKSLDELLWPKAVEDESGCWLWTAACNNRGYGYLDYRPVQTKRVRLLAHRAAYMLWNGAILGSNEIDHTCSVRSCINPAHLEQVTRRENCLRVAAKRTHCPHGHPYSGDNVYHYLARDGRRSRMCRACMHGKAKGSRAAV